MPLPIVSHSSESLLRLFAKSQLHWSQHLAEETQLDYATAFINPDLSKDPDANCLLDINIPNNFSPHQILDETEKLFANHGSRCLRWIPRPDSDITPLAELLRKQNHTLQQSHLFYLTGASPSPDQPNPLQILPARSSFKHVRAIAEQQANTESQLLHLDDPHADAFIALLNGEPAAYLATLTMGEVGVIENLYVSEKYRRQGFGRTMLHRAIELASRAQWRHVMIAVPSECPELSTLVQHSGFTKIGDWPTYIASTHRESPKR